MAGLRALQTGAGELDRFKADLCSYFAAKHCFLVSSGKTALALILQALKRLYPGRDEVLIPAFTCYSVPSAIVRAGLKVSLCDVGAGFFGFDMEKLEQLLLTRTVTYRSSWRGAAHAASPEALSATRHGCGGDLSGSTKPFLAIVPTHLFGFAGRMDQLQRLASHYGLPVVEDAAQAMGEAINTRKLGTFGDVGFFSLGRGKAFSTVEGGVILTDRNDIALQLSMCVESLPDYTLLETAALISQALSIVVLQRPSFFWLPRSLPFLKLGETIYDPNFTMKKMSPFQAGLARDWRSKLEEFRAIRRQNVAWCKVVLGSMQVRHYCEDNGTGHSLLRFPVSIDDTAKREVLLSRGSGLGIMPSYPDSIDAIEALHAPGGRSFKHARKAARTLVTIPVHPLVSKKDKARIAELLEDVLGECAKK